LLHKASAYGISFAFHIEWDVKRYTQNGDDTGSHFYDPVSGDISHFTPCAHAQSDIKHIKYAQKTDDTD